MQQIFNSGVVLPGTLMFFLLLATLNAYENNTIPNNDTSLSSIESALYILKHDLDDIKMALQHEPRKLRQQSIGSKYFLFGSENKTWNDADAACRHFPGGHLVSIDTLQEVDRVKEAITNFPFKERCKWGYWTAAKSNTRLNVWEWTNSISPIKAELWNTWHKETSANCGIWYPPGNNLKSKPCSYKYCHICEFD